MNLENNMGEISVGILHIHNIWQACSYKHTTLE